MTHPAKTPRSAGSLPHGAAPSPPSSRDREPDTLVRATSGPISKKQTSGSMSSRFLAQLALYTDGIGTLQVLESWRRHGVLARLLRSGEGGVRLGQVAAESGANLGYLAVVCRVLSVRGYLWQEPALDAREQRAGLTRSGTALFELLETGTQSSLIRAFMPVARHMAAYLEGSFVPPSSAPSLEQLSRWSARGWDLPRDGDDTRRAMAGELAAALDGNLLGPVAAALALGESNSFEWAREPERRSYLGKNEARGAEPSSDVQRAAFDVLANAGWASWHGERLELTDFGAYALRRASAYGVPVSYLPLFEDIDQLCFGDAEAFWRRVADEPERHVDRTLNVRASGASHARYFAAADEIIARAFDLPFPEQPRGFCDMGSGDGSWLQHVWELIENRTERGRLMRAFPHDTRYRPLLVGADYNEAARAATRARLLEAGIPHLVIFGDVNDPAGLRSELARRGVDSRQLLHGNSFLVHNRPFTGVRDHEAAARRAGANPALGAYDWRGQALRFSDIEQNLVEFFDGWRGVLGPHGMVSIELHDPERAIAKRTLTNYMLTHGLSDQLTVPLNTFLSAAAEAGLHVDDAHLRLFPTPREAAAISVSHLLAR